jgi:hypothetical protein
MSHTIKTFGTIGVFLSLLWLSACSTSPPTSTPTLDLNPFRTEVAATVFAQVSRDLSLTPSITPIPSPTATFTNISTPTQEVSLSPSPKVTLSLGTPITGTTDHAQWVSQSIADNTIFAPGETFTITWRLKNVGISTWTVSYMLRFFSGDAFGAPKEILLGRVVLPNETIEISIPMKAPANSGNYRTDWVLSNESRSNFKDPVFLKITVATPSTPSPTSTVTPSSTATP